MTARSLQFVVPGELRTATGGYGYDRRIIAGLRALGWQVTVHSLDASFPDPTAAALEHAHGVLANMRDRALVLIDGLALGAMPQIVQSQRARLALLALVHHPLAAESGITADRARRLQQSERQALQSVRHVIVTSRATRQALSAYGVASGNVSVVEPGTDAAPLAPGHGGDSVRMLCVGAIIARKGHDVLIDALAPLALPSPALPSPASRRWHLTCVGSLTASAVTVARLRSQIQRAGLVERVTLVGDADDIALATHFQDADLFVLPTRFEGYGMAVAEALAHGLPVISTPTGGIPELIGTRAGILVQPDDAGMLHTALARVLNEPMLLASLARGAALARATLPRWRDACARMSGILEDAGHISHRWVP